MLKESAETVQTVSGKPEQTSRVAVGIYSIGTRGVSQAAMRPDGVWFMRARRLGVKGSSWGGWVYWGRTRPENAWYNPANRRAYLPKD